jgi:hypothetical protein
MKTRTIGILSLLTIMAVVCHLYSANHGESMLETFMKIQGAAAKKGYLDTLSEEHFLQLANEAGRYDDPSGELLGWIVRNGLLPRWEQKQLSPEKHLSLICNTNLSPAWRTGLIDLVRYNSAWSVEQIDLAIREALRLLKDPSLGPRNRGDLASSLSRVVYANWMAIDQDSRLSMAQKKELVEKLQSTITAIVKSLSESLLTEPEAEDHVLRGYVFGLSDLAGAYLTQKESYTSKYKQGAAFAETVKAAESIRVAFKQVLNSGKYPPQTVLWTVRSMVDNGWGADMPANLVELYKSNPRFSRDDLERLARILAPENPNPNL